MFYQESKTAKGAAIGTIMPWGGGITSIPKGWIVCDGQNEDAAAYPLLAQTIGDTYNSGTSSFGGDFPSYTGTIKMPDLNDKALMDLETDYFGAGGSSTGRSADQDTDALTLLSNKIGTHESQSIVTAFTDVYTDVVFTLPQTDATGYQGRIRGNTKEDGEGFKTIYVAPRKLGRKHVQSHGHSGNYATISALNEAKPGQGVIPYGEVEYTARFMAVDNQWGNDIGDTFYWGWTDDSSGAHDDNSPWWRTAWNFTAPGISVGDKKNSSGDNPHAVPGTADNENAWYPAGNQTGPWQDGDMDGAVDRGSNDHLYQLWWPDENTGGGDIPQGIGGGSPGVVLAKVESTPPPSDLTPISVTDTPITPQFIVTPSHPDGPRIDSNTTYQYAQGGNPMELPEGLRNYYIEDGVTTLPYDFKGSPGSTIPVTPETGLDIRQTMMSHQGFNFLSNSNTDKIDAHEHDEIDVEFDSTRLRAPTTLIANVNIPTQADFLGNAENKSALQIDFNVSQPQMTCIYIIRAY
tara:strand:+ start:116 stop:1672 length:1557 start_codon:yes stop_codon:yes gene_type:complete